MNRSIKMKKETERERERVHMTEMLNAYKCLVFNTRQWHIVCTAQ